MSSPRILLIDAYDSFSNNLSVLLSTSIPNATIHIIHIDTPFTSLSSLLPYLPSFDFLVVGPGPGSPANTKDVGIVQDLWTLSSEHTLPIFGVCLGLQSMVLAFSGKVEKMRVVKHGSISSVIHNGRDLFANVGEVNAVRYHSLHAIPAENGEIEPLAWTSDENGQVLMAARHTSKPFWAVQYHPESICTSGGGASVIQNFWRLASLWNTSRRRKIQPLPETWGIKPREQTLLQKQLSFESTAGITREEGGAGLKVRTKTVPARGLEITSICELLGVEGRDEFILLDSAAAPGRFSVIGVVTPALTRLFRYSAGDAYLTASIADVKDSEENISLVPYEHDIWRYLSKFMSTRRATSGREEVPFWGGLMGYFSYELGVASLNIPLKYRGQEKKKDVNLAFVERSLVVDTFTGKIYIQTLLPESVDGGWLETMKRRIQQEADIAITPAATPPPCDGEQERGGRNIEKQKEIEKVEPKSPTIIKPSRKRYIQQIRDCQRHLSTGDSYELCLTAQTTLHLRPGQNPWNLYTTLRERNPAPYAAYLRLAGTTVLSSSPERFLSWSRTGTCQLRPIKGTVKKTPGMTRSDAEALLGTEKERAENLMILDLIRHDLHGIVGENVTVKKLMGVEEYRSVWQLVSVIEGIISVECRDTEEGDGMTGFDVLAKSLPPGSMTGAPKKRSVELLADVEGAERGVYSGALGYWSVCGAGDWCVVIRTAVCHEDEDENGDSVWRVGAGGAVTALSTEVGEWEEMEVKLASTLKGFGA
ncbi:para-aminobenzoate synthase, (PABA) [Rhizina undulata]